jgi:hypothetical protein
MIDVTENDVVITFIWTMYVVSIIIYIVTYIIIIVDHYFIYVNFNDFI